MIKTRSQCWSVYAKGQIIYAGVNDGVQLIIDNLVSEEYPVQEPCAIQCLRVKEPYLYKFYQIKNWWLIAQSSEDDPESGDLKNWRHDDSEKRFNQFVILDDTIYVPNRSKNCINLYTLTGDHAGEDLPLKLASTNTFICATPTGELVISQTHPPLLICLDPKTRQKLWHKDNLTFPQAVIADHYSKTHPILVYTENPVAKVAYLDVRKPETGKVSYGKL